VQTILQSQPSHSVQPFYRPPLRFSGDYPFYLRFSYSIKKITITFGINLNNCSAIIQLFFHAIFLSRIYRNIHTHIISYIFSTEMNLLILFCNKNDFLQVSFYTVSDRYKHV
jgi:hypothetical protein